MPIYVEEVIGDEEEEENRTEDENEDEEEDEAEQPALEENIAALPEMRDKEAAAVVQARNSVAAAWLWRKFAADTPLAQNELHITPVCIPTAVVTKD
jgi:uncharacterized protein YhaN